MFGISNASKSSQHGRRSALRRSGRYREGGSPIISTLTVICLLAASVVSFTGLQGAKGLATDPATCSATIDRNPTDPSASPIITNEASANSLIGDTTLTSDEDASPSFQLPFGLDQRSGGTWSARVEANGAVSLGNYANESAWMWDRQNTFNVFLADLDSTNTGEIRYGLCAFTLDGVQYDGFSVTWSQVPYYGRVELATFQFILIKTSTYGFTTVRNYESLNYVPTVDVEIPRTMFFEPAIEQYLHVPVNQAVAGRDVDSDFMAGTSGYFNPAFTEQFLDGGSSQLSLNSSSGTSQIGRYIKSLNQGGPCDLNVSPQLDISYSAPLVYEADSSFTNLLTENFDSFAAGGLASPSATQVGTMDGSIFVMDADPNIGAGLTGRGASVRDATFTPSNQSCYRYLGFWWSSGNSTNYVQLLDSHDNVLADFSAADLYSSLQGEPSYFGNPSNQQLASNEIFAYVNIRYSAGFSKIRFFGAGFELDNISISVNSQTIGADETLLSPSTEPSPSASASPSPSSSPTSTPPPTPRKPVIDGIDITLSDVVANTFLKPTSPQLTVSDDGIIQDSGWFLCDNPHLDVADYDLSTPFPADCAFTDNRNDTYSPGPEALGKYVGFWVYASNAVGSTFALQTTASRVGDVRIINLQNVTPTEVSGFSILGNAASSTAGWYLCENPATDQVTMPTGQCLSTGVTSLEFTPTLADLGKYLVYKVTAIGADTANFAQAVTSDSSPVNLGYFINQLIADFVVSLLDDLTGAEASNITTQGGASMVGGQWWVCDSAIDEYHIGTFTDGSNPVLDESNSAMETSGGCTPIPGQRNPALVPMDPNYNGKYLSFAVSASYADIYIVKAESTLVSLPSASPSPSSSASVTAEPTPTTTPSPSPTETSPTGPNIPEASVHTVYFHANGGLGEMEPLSSSTPKLLSRNSFTREKFVFLGWSKSPTEKLISYQDGSLFDFSTRLDLYAQWTLVKSKTIIKTFVGDRSELRKAMLPKIKNWVLKVPENATITCLGSTSGSKVTWFDRILALKRAKNVCGYATKVRPDLKVERLINPSSSTRTSARHVWIYFNQ